MAQIELDSYVLKFKNLWKSGGNASLSIKSNDEEATESVDMAKEKCSNTNIENDVQDDPQQNKF